MGTGAIGKIPVTPASIEALVVKTGDDFFVPPSFHRG
jgi:hypothetical protein